MASSSDEGRVTAAFTEGVSSSADWELAIDENASSVSLAPKPIVAPDLSVAVREEEESVLEFLDYLSGEESASIRQNLGGEADDDDCFVDIMIVITAVGDAESEGWTFADAMASANSSMETLAEGVVDSFQLPTYWSSSFISH